LTFYLIKLLKFVGEDSRRWGKGQSPWEF